MDATSPPTSEYVVTADQMPITTPGAHLFQAHLGGATSMIWWRIDDSRTLGIDPDTSFTTTGPMATVTVTSGSYRLRFRVSLDSTIWSQQEIPVCTTVGGGGALARRGGGISTTAVGQCPPPEAP